LGQQILGILAVRRIFHRVQVIEVAEELIEPMNRGKEFIEVWIVGTSKHERKLKPFKFVLLESLCQFGRLTGRGSSECLSDLVFHLMVFVALGKLLILATRCRAHRSDRALPE
jgi:hypothetical protein